MILVGVCISPTCDGTERKHSISFFLTCVTRECDALAMNFMNLPMPRNAFSFWTSTAFTHWYKYNGNDYTTAEAEHHPR